MKNGENTGDSKQVAEYGHLANMVLYVYLYMYMYLDYIACHNKRYFYQKV